MGKRGGREKKERKKVAAVNARRLRQYLQLSDKILAIFRGVLPFFAVFQNTYLFHYFPRNPKRRSAEPCFRNTGLGP